MPCPSCSTRRRDPCALIPDPAQERITKAVRAGVGLVLLGGRGIAGGPLEKILPLTDAPPQGRAALLLLDVSGSMDELMDELTEATERLRSSRLTIASPAPFQPARQGLAWQRAEGARPQRSGRREHVPSACARRGGRLLAA
jgi:hypothetical protein